MESSLISPLDKRRDDLSAPQAAAILRIDPKLLTRWAKAGLVPGAYKPFPTVGKGQGSPWIFRLKPLLEWWDRQVAAGTPTPAESPLANPRKKRKKQPA